MIRCDLMGGPVFRARGARRLSAADAGRPLDAALRLCAHSPHTVLRGWVARALTLAGRSSAPRSSQAVPQLRLAGASVLTTRPPPCPSRSSDADRKRVAGGRPPFLASTALVGDCTRGGAARREGARAASVARPLETRRTGLSAHTRRATATVCGLARWRGCNWRGERARRQTGRQTGRAGKQAGKQAGCLGRVRAWTGRRLALPPSRPAK